MRLCSICAIRDMCNVSKYLGTSIWLFLNVYLKLLWVGVSGHSAFQSLKAVSKNALF